MFFPFDPYLLKRSAKLLQLPQTYVRWRRGHASVPKDQAGRGGAADMVGEDAVQGDSDGEDEDEESDEGGYEEDDDMDEDRDEDGDESSDELEGMSLPSDSLLSRPRVPSGRSPQALHMRPPKHPRVAHGDAPFLGAAEHHRRGGGRGGPKHGGFGRSHDEMAVSYSPSSFNEVAGTSPLLVNYDNHVGSGSPMQMTPVHNVMEQSFRKNKN